MLITVDSVLVENRGKYKIAVVNYNGNKKQNVVSFGASAEAFQSLNSAQAGSNWEIVTAPNQKDSRYIDWVKAIPANNAKPSTEAKGQRTSTYETPEERALKQVYIIKQSSLERALQYWELTKNTKATPGDVMDLAQLFVNWILGKEQVEDFNPIKDLEEDIPF